MNLCLRFQRKNCLLFLLEAICFELLRCYAGSVISFLISAGQVPFSQLALLSALSPPGLLFQPALLFCSGAMGIGFCRLSLWLSPITLTTQLSLLCCLCS